MEMEGKSQKNCAETETKGNCQRGEGCAEAARQRGCVSESDIVGCGVRSSKVWNSGAKEALLTIPILSPANKAQQCEAMVRSVASFPSP